MSPKVVEVIVEIDRLTTRINKESKWDDGEWMSRAIVSLASLNSTLGVFVAEYEREASLKSAHAKLAAEQIKLEIMRGENKDYDDAKSAAYADTAKVIATAEEAEAAVQASYNHRVLQIKRVDTHELVEAMRSRLSYLKQEMLDSKKGE